MAHEIPTQRPQIDAIPGNIHGDSNPSWLARTSDWVSSSASEAWTATSGVARVAGQVGLGAVEQAYEHPLKTAAQIGGTALAVGAAAELGIGMVGAAAIAVVPAAGYGLYRGAQIAAHEGVGAIPAHMKETYKESKEAVLAAADAAVTVYRGDASTDKMATAQNNLQNVGRAAEPFIVGGMGAAGGRLGQTAIIGGEAALSSLASGLKNGLNALPKLTLTPALEPALVGAAGAIGAAGAAGAAGAEASQALSFGAKTAGKIVGNGVTSTDVATADVAPPLKPSALTPTTEAAQSAAARDNGSDWLDASRNKRTLVDGRTPPLPHDLANSGAVGLLQDAFKNPDKILSAGGQVGYLQMSREVDGTIIAQFTDGPLRGVQAMHAPGQSTFQLESVKNAKQTYDVPMKN